MSIKDKLKQALEYKSSSFRLIKTDPKTELSRDDIYELLSLYPKTDKEIIDEYRTIERRTRYGRVRTKSIIK